MEEVMGASAITGALYGSIALHEWEAPGRWLGGYEKFLELLTERAKPHVREAEELVATLRRARTEEDVVEIPTYGTARRVRCPSITYQARYRQIRLGSKAALEPAVEIAGEDIFIVDDVEPWSPDWDLPAPPAGAWLSRPMPPWLKKLALPWWKRLF